MKVYIILGLITILSSLNLVKSQELTPNHKKSDTTQIGTERKMLRKYYRQQRRLARINNGGYNNNFYTYSYNPYNSYNPYVYNYGYVYPPYTFTPYCGLNTVVNTTLLGLYWLIR